MAAVPPDLFNTAVSFLTNTSWQSYAGESTLSYLSQMLEITVQSFLSRCDCDCADPRFCAPVG